MKQNCWARRVWIIGLGLTLFAGVEAGESDKESEKSYVDDPNAILEYSDPAAMKQAEGAGAEKVRGIPSPTGSGIMYVRDPIEPVTFPPFEGERYEATAPDTLDLAERGALALHAITNLADPAQDYEIFGWIGNIKSGQVYMKHSYHDYNGGQAKWMMGLPLVRTMSGLEDNMHVDQGMMETMFRMIGEDGLYWIPAQGASWIGESDSVAPWTRPGVKQVYDIWPNGRVLLCLVSWYARDPRNEALKANIERMIDAFSRIAIRKDGCAWLPRHFYEDYVLEDQPEQAHVPMGGTAVTSQSTILPGIARYYALTGYPPAKELGEQIVRYWLNKAEILEENGEWIYGGGTHFHGTTFILIGLLDWAIATGDTALQNRLAGAYEFARAGGNALIGWMPEGYPAVHPNSEPCGIGDMTVFAAKLSRHGIGDYWEDVERYSRNLLASAQITDSWFAERRAAESQQGTPGEAFDTGHTYAEGRPQGLMMRIDGATGNIRLFYQDGGARDLHGQVWKDITPAQDPHGLLRFAPGPNKVGINNMGTGDGNFVVDAIGLFEGPDGAQTLIEDDFTPGPGEMPIAGGGDNVNIHWRFNETADKQANAYDGAGKLILPMRGAWHQYIDASVGDLQPGVDYTFMCIFTMPDSGEEVLGLTRDGGMASGDPTRVFKLRDGKILFSNDVWLTPGGLFRAPLESADNVAWKMRGTFSGMTSATGQFQTVSSHCCTGNGTRGLYYAWRDILSADGGELRVNLLFNRASKWADVNSFLPYTGRVDVLMKSDQRLLVRMPSWVEDPATVQCDVDENPRECDWQGRYLAIGEVKAGQTVSVRFPLTDETVRTQIAWNSKQGRQTRDLTLRMRGFNVVDIWPRREDVLFPFFADPRDRDGKVRWKTTQRFAPAHEAWW